jgi:flagellar motor switch protein FliG
LAEEIKKRMFVFEDIITLDDRSIQQIMREVETKDLALALKGASEEVAQKIQKNMSKRAADMLKEDMEYMGPVRLRDVEEAQQRIVNIVRKLEESGEIIIARGGGDEMIV